MSFDPSEPLEDGDLDLELESFNGKTMSVRRARFGGKLRFNNKDGTQKLLVMSPAPTPPFVISDGQPPVSWFEVPAGQKKVVKISTTYAVNARFAYTTLIEGSAAEDPIVIVDH
jgi:hypothetical protein